jgi:phospholipid/cholesterol/gamma-HCH transport system substrate-binding protein
VNALESGDGVLHNLIFEKSDAVNNRWLTGTLNEISVAAHSIQKVLHQLETGEGILHELLYTSVEPGLEPLGTRLERIITNLDQATTSLAKGGGTLGALLIDSTLYDNLVDVTDEAKRSYVLRSAIRATMEE